MLILEEIDSLIYEGKVVDAITGVFKKKPNVSRYAAPYATAIRKKAKSFGGKRNKRVRMKNPTSKSRSVIGSNAPKTTPQKPPAILNSSGKTSKISPTLKKAAVVGGAVGATAAGSHLYNKYEQAGTAREMVADAAKSAANRKLLATGAGGIAAGAGAYVLMKRNRG